MRWNLQVSPYEITVLDGEKVVAVIYGTSQEDFENAARIVQAPEFQEEIEFVKNSHRALLRAVEE